MRTVHRISREDLLRLLVPSKIEYERPPRYLWLRSVGIAVGVSLFLLACFYGATYFSNKAAPYVYHFASGEWRHDLPYIRP